MVARCPICGRSFEFVSFEATPSFPFCMERCRLIDLGRWIDGDYRISGTARDPDEEGGEEPVGPDESDPDE